MSMDHTYRSIFVSDIHFGTRDCKAEQLNNFLKHNSCDTLYLVGDIIDAWKIQQNKWRWKQSHTNAIRRILGHAKRGTRVIYVAGNHTANIQNLNGNANNIGITQTGAGTHSMTITGGTGTTNSNNTIDVTQSGGVGADKTYNLWLNGATGAGVTVQQTNPTQSNQGSMNIQCNPCGSGWSYIRN